MIRLAKPEDFNSIVELLNNNFVEPPFEFDEIRDMCYIAEVDGKIEGTIWTLAGRSSTAYIGFLAVNAIKKRGGIFRLLIKATHTEMKKRGVKRYTFTVAKWNTRAISLLHKYSRNNNIEKLEDLFYFRKEL